MNKLTYENFKQCSSAQGIPAEQLSIARNVFNAPGFRGCRIDWHDLKPWLDEHKEELETYAAQDMSEVKRQNLLKDGILKDLQIAERRGEVLNPKEVVTFLQSMANAQSVVLNTKEREITAKVDAGTAKLIKTAFNDVRKIFTNGLGEWIVEHKINS